MTLAMYVLQVTHVEDNPAYDPKAYRSYNEPSAPATIERIVLTMHVTPEQFDAIRRAALEVAK